MLGDQFKALFRGESKSKWLIGANVITHQRQRQCIQRLLRLAECEAPIVKVLDCPSGAGRMVDLLQSWQVTCGDITGERLEVLKSHFPKSAIQTRICDVFDMPFSEDQFDLVLTCSLVQHIDKSRLHSMLEELRRVTARWLIITYPSSFSLSNIYGNTRKRGKTTLTRVEFSRLTSEAGFRINSCLSVLPVIAAGRVVLLEKV
jgi:hypothetical protein